MGTALNKELQISKRLEQNDPSVFDEIFKVFYPSIVYFAVSLVSNREEGEDIAMETFRKFWQLRDRFKTLANIKAFLYITTRNTSLNYLNSAQHKRTRSQILDEGHNNEPFSHEPAIDNLLIEAETLQLIYNAVKQLPPKCRQIFELTYFEGKSNSEISKELNISTSTITTQRSRALHLLKENLKGIEWILIWLSYWTSMF